VVETKVRTAKNATVRGLKPLRFNGEWSIFIDFTSLLLAWRRDDFPRAGLKLCVHLRNLRIMLLRFVASRKLELRREKGFIISRHRNPNFTSNAVLNLDG
jgi:hypothetical protein